MAGINSHNGLEETIAEVIKELYGEEVPRIADSVVKGVPQPCAEHRDNEHTCVSQPFSYHPCQKSLSAGKSGFHARATSYTNISLNIHTMPSDAPITYTVI
ncbi:hypothetical protein E2C01_093453 [Portunus trituberculatus]|uniref:Uncharacterized protein n=1 Tax=Portunus trituberculatus TaxID=210409 RepID=A0A5B7JMS2_PORTR|nr:hypothetical protein [Portunus trituberculatus]